MKILLLKILLTFLLIFSVAGNVISGSPSKDISLFLNGKVTDERKFPVPFVKVIYGSKEVLTDRFGKFSLTNVTFPYTLTIAEKTSSTAVIYKDLTLSNPELIIFGDLKEQFSNYVQLKVRFPKISEGGSAVIKMISQEVFDCKEAKAGEGDSTVNLNILWPVSENYLKGEIVFLLRDKQGFQTIKYLKVSVYKNDRNKTARINNKKGSSLSTSAINVYQPASKSLKTEFNVSLNFFNYNLNSAIKFSENSDGAVKTHIWVPDKLSVTNKILVTGFGRFNNGSGYAGLNFVSPGAELKLYPESPPELFTPSDNYLGAAGNTNFSYSLGSGTGIYVIEFKSINPYLNLYIVTSERQSTLNYLSRNEFKNYSAQFTWSVKKYLTYFNTDEFVRPKVFKNDFSYKAVLYSDKRKFKTGFY